MSKDFVFRMVNEGIKPLTRHADGFLDGKWRFTGKGFTLPCVIPNVVLGIESARIQQEKFIGNEMAWLLGDEVMEARDIDKAMQAFGMAQDEQGDWDYDGTEEGDSYLTELEVDDNGMLAFGEESESYTEELEI